MFPTLSTNPLNLNMNMMSMAMLTRPEKPNSCFSSSSSSSTFLPHCNIQSLRFLPPRSLLRPNKNNCYKWKHSMFISAKPLLKNGTLSLNGHEAITGVPDNVFLTPLTDSSAFLGATSSQSSSRHVFKLGVIQ